MYLQYFLNEQLMKSFVDLTLCLLKNYKNRLVKIPR